MTDGTHYAFPIQVKLPFGQLQVEITADRVSDGSIRGTATAPHRKPMRLVGNLV